MDPQWKQLTFTTRILIFCSWKFFHREFIFLCAVHSDRTINLSNISSKHEITFVWILFVSLKLIINLNYNVRCVNRVSCNRSKFQLTNVSHRLESNQRTVLVCSTCGQSYICVTAAVSGTEYCGEWAASDLLVTCTFAVALGNLCLAWPLYFSLRVGSTQHAGRVVHFPVLYSYPLC